MKPTQKQIDAAAVALVRFGQDVELLPLTKAEAQGAAKAALEAAFAAAPRWEDELPDEWGDIPDRDLGDPFAMTPEEDAQIRQGQDDFAHGASYADEEAPAGRML